jgi:RNA polymerase sigma-70 factor, ECF subfamily
MLDETQRLEFARLYDESRRAIHREARRLTRDGASALDLMQDTYERAYRSYGSYVSRGRGILWLRTIMRRLFIDSYRRGRSCERLEEVHCAVTEPEKPAVWRTISDDDLARVLDGLPDSKRALLELHVYQRQSYAALAARFGLRTQTVGSRLNRTRELLRRTLTTDSGDAMRGGRSTALARRRRPEAPIENETGEQP